MSSRVAKWSRFLTALIGAVGILLAGLFLLRAEIIKERSNALWPTYGLLNLEAFGNPPPASEMWFPYAVHVAIWTAFLYAVLSLGEILRRR